MSGELEAWLAPLAGDAPEGPDPRGLAAYQRLRDEIARLESPGAGPCRWDAVERDAIAVLASSKDLVSASYLACALAQRRGLSGLVLGSSLLAAILDRVPSPHPARPRARAGALAWYLDRAEAIASGISVGAADRARVFEWKAALGLLSETSRAKLDASAPSVRRLEDAAERLALALPPAPDAALASVSRAASASEPALAPPSGSALGTAPSQGSAATTSSSPQALSAAPAQASASMPEPSSAPAQASSALAPGSASVSAPGSAHAHTPDPAARGSGHDRSSAAPAAALPAAMAAPITVDPGELSRAPMLLAQVGSALLAAARVRRAAAPLDPEAIRLLLAGLHLPITRAPAANAMPAPAASLRAEIGSLAASREPVRAIEAAAIAVEKQRFWIDAYHALHRALEQAGAREAAAIHATELRALWSRLPELLDRTFADGSPFASPDARAWAESLLVPAATGSIPGSAVDDRRAALAASARDALRAGDARAALAEAQRAVRGASCQRDRFEARIALVEIALEARQPAIALAIGAELLRESSARGLADWDPALEARACQVYLRAANDKTSIALPIPSAEVYARLCVIDPASAARADATLGATPR